ncbi:60S ribosomal protein L23, partial [Trifolium medium]|nr:60S ribosomal protein L23 [Trifolium medium]
MAGCAQCITSTPAWYKDKSCCHTSNSYQQQRCLCSSSDSKSSLEDFRQWHGMLKCNIDATIFKEQNCYGISMCVIDDKGNFIRARTLWKHGSLLPHELEAWGLKEAIIWLRELGFVNVVIEIDCKLMVDGIN